MELSDSLLCVFSATVEEQDGTFVIEVPQREVTVGDIERDEVYRIALVDQGGQDGERGGTRSPSKPDRKSPPVEDGEVLDVEIEDVGDQGDGIARVGPGYVIIVPDTEMGERVSIEVTEVRANMAFAEVVERHDDFS